MWLCIWIPKNLPTEHVVNIVGFFSCCFFCHEWSQNYKKIVYTLAADTNRACNTSLMSYNYTIDGENSIIYLSLFFGLFIVNLIKLFS